MPSSRTLVAAVVAALALTLTAGGPPRRPLPRPQPARRRLVLAFRHAATDFSKPDQDPVAPRAARRSATSRRRAAPRRARSAAPCGGSGSLSARFYSSAYCRTLETARLAFGRATVHPALLNTIAAEHDAAWRKQIRDVRRLLGTRPAPGKIDRARHARRRRLGHDRADRSRRARRSSSGRSGTAASASSDASCRASGGRCGSRPRPRRRVARAGVHRARRLAPTRRRPRARRDGLVHGPGDGQARPARPGDGGVDGDPAR